MNMYTDLIRSVGMPHIPLFCFFTEFPHFCGEASSCTDKMKCKEMSSFCQQLLQGRSLSPIIHCLCQDSSIVTMYMYDRVGLLSCLSLCKWSFQTQSPNFVIRCLRMAGQHVRPFHMWLDRAKSTIQCLKFPKFASR